MTQPLTFVHLSDLHFGAEYTGSEHDLDRDLRNEVVHDLRGLRAELPEVDGILISGDIAYSGSAAEYEFAREWLEELTEELDLLPSDIWVVAGNHDVDRRVFSDTRAPTALRRRLREETGGQVKRDSILRDYATAVDTGPAILTPFHAFNEFAAAYGCNFSPEGLTWQHDFPLTDGFKLRVHGLNSALISNSQDNQGAHKLFAGTAQLQLERDAGIVYLVLCHHPPDWLLDQDSVERRLASRCPVQLFGHKHDHTVRLIDSSLRLYSGALHPPRAERDWNPRYNILSLTLIAEESERHLQVRTWLREWDQNQVKFVADRTQDGAAYRVDRLPLDVVPPTPARSTPAKKETGVTHGGSQSGSEEPSPERNMVPSNGDSNELVQESMGRAESPRMVVYQFFQLPYHERIELIVDQGLLEEGDRGLKEQELFSRVFARIRERNALDEFRRAVESRLDR